MEELETLESVFRSRGYEIIRSSRDNHYLLLSKGGSLMAVGYSMSPKKTTEGEADMFISMGQNDSADSMLYISPMKLSRVVKRTLEREGVATWDRMAVAIAIGEQVLNDWARGETEGSSERSVMDLFNTEDVDPLQEVRDYHEEVSSKEIGGFRVHDIEMGSTTIETIKDIKPEILAPPKQENPPEPEPENEGPQMEMDLPMMPMMDMESPLEEPVKPGEKEPSKQDHKVPEKILMAPWDGFDEWKEKEPTKGTKVIDEEKLASKDPPKPIVSGWEGTTVAPVKYSNTDAISLAGEGEETELKMVNYPFILLEASYRMDPEDGKGDPIEQDGIYLYDCIRKDIFDVPDTVYDEIASIEMKWNGKDGPGVMTDPKEDHNKAMVTLRQWIKNRKLAKDRKVSDTLMSTIYREVDYKFDPRSLKLISSRRVILPFWVKEKKRTAQGWSVNAFLGQLIK